MNALCFEVLRRLADGEFHSGAALARTLRVSRGTIWNAVRAIESAGVTVYKVKGRGYKLAQSISLLDQHSIAEHIGAASSRFSIHVTDVSSSTNTDLLARAADGAPCGTVIAAEWQTHGRGRMGRSWHANIGDALTFSLLWRFEHGAAKLAGLSLAAGIALVRALESLGIENVRLKWPNDVLWHGAKLAGILIEMHGDAWGPSVVIIGIGLNVRLSSAMRASIDQPIADLESIRGGTLDRNVVLGAILVALAVVLDQFSTQGFASLQKEWERYHTHQGQSVALKLPSGRIEEGIARGVAADGALLFQQGESVRRLHSGEISLREAFARTSNNVRARSRV